jgi:hypothetical protein
MGLGKRGPLFEEAFGMSLVRTLRHAMEDHPIIVASKAPLGTAPALEQRMADIEVEMNEQAERGSPITVRARVTNRGSSAWRAISPSGTGHVRLGVQLLDPDGRLRVRDYHRVSFPADMRPGTSIDISFSCPAPGAQGEYLLKFDLVAEGVTWFEAAGSPVVTRRVEVG